MLLLKRVLALAMGVMVCLAPVLARAQELSLLRDAEIENTLRLYGAPLFKQAGVNPDAVHIHIVNDMTINAFVADGLNMFINAGLIIRTKNPDELIGVMAHESGHIAGGHLVRADNAMDQAQGISLAGMILGLAAALAGAPGAAAGVMMKTNDIAERQFLAFSRSVEGSADSAALTFLDNLHISARGFLDFMQSLEGEEMLNGADQDPYVRTHPLTEDRVDEIKTHVEASPWSNTMPPAAYDEPHQRMRAKLAAFLQPPVTTLRQYPATDTSIPAQYARAIAYYRIPDLTQALPAIDALIAARPDDPFFHELKGQMLFENARVAEAAPEYRAAVRLFPDNALLCAELGQVDVELGDPASLADAVTNLKTATAKDPLEPEPWRLLSTAYDRLGNPVQSEVAVAVYSLFSGDYEAAIYHANHVLPQLKPGTPDALRMEDIRVQGLQMRDRDRRSHGG